MNQAKDVENMSAKPISRWEVAATKADAHLPQGKLQSCRRNCTAIPRINQDLQQSRAEDPQGENQVERDMGARVDSTTRLIPDHQFGCVPHQRDGDLDFLA